MYCGDETAAYIADIGSHTARFGYGGEDCPKLVLPSAVYRHHDSTSSTSPKKQSKRKTTKYSAPVSLLNLPPDDCFNDKEVGFVPIFSINSNNSTKHQLDTDALSELWEYSFQSLSVRSRKKHTVGSSDASSSDGPIDHPLLASIDHTHSQKEHASILEMMFESLSAPAAYLAPSATLSSFAFGRQSALVVDVGHESCRVTPVMDGYALRHGSVRSCRGGEWLGRAQEKILISSEVGSACCENITPRYVLRNDNVEKLKKLNESVFHRMTVHEVMYEMMTGLHVLPLKEEAGSFDLFCEEGDGDDVNEEEEKEGPVYVLPDGTRVNVGSSGRGRALCHLPVRLCVFLCWHVFILSNASILPAGAILLRIITKFLTN